jgi:hypothetical protein
LLLDRLTVTPFPPAGAFSATKQLSAPAPTIDELEQEIPLSTAEVGGAATLTPSPLRLTVVGPPVVMLLATVTWPAAEPALDGVNCTSKL